jgi:hypothetical protein
VGKYEWKVAEIVLSGSPTIVQFSGCFATFWE